MEVRTLRSESPNFDPAKDYLYSNVKRAMNALTTYPLRVYDEVSAQDVTNIGAAMAKASPIELFWITVPT